MTIRARAAPALVVEGSDFVQMAALMPFSYLVPLVTANSPANKP
jgi:hypothetical protein